MARTLVKFTDVNIKDVINKVYKKDGMTLDESYRKAFSVAIEDVVDADNMNDLLDEFTKIVDEIAESTVLRNLSVVRNRKAGKMTLNVKIDMPLIDPDALVERLKPYLE